MDELFALIILAVIAIPVLSIVAIVMASSARSQARRLDDHLRRHEARLALLETRLAAQPASPTVSGAKSEAAADAAGAPSQPAVAETVPAAQEETVAASAGSRVADAAINETAQDELPPAAIARPSRRRGFDERQGARWAVWVGGIALALGSVFLVKYSIEQGFFGPGMRILLGLLLSLLLLGLGEWFRRKEAAETIAGLPGEHIPSVLTGAGTVAAFASVYAAHALYAMIGPGMAFALLGVIGIATLFASALHKPWVAALGLVGAYATPLLIDSPAPNYWAFCSYLAIVSAAALKLADWRHMLWLAISSVAAAIVWGMLIALSALPFRAELELVLYVLALGALFAHVFALRPTFRDAWAGLLPLAAATALAILAMGVWLNATITGPTFIAVLVLMAGMMVLAAKDEANHLLSLLAAAFAICGYALWATDAIVEPNDWATHAAAPAGYAFVGLVLGGLLAAGGLVLAVLSPRRATAAAAGVAGPLVLFVLAYRGLTYTPPAASVTSEAFGIMALAIAAALVSLSTMLARLEDKHPQDAGYPQALGIYAAGSVTALALGLAMLLEKGWLVVGLALASFAAAWISTQRPVPYLRAVAAATGVVVAIQILRSPIIAPHEVGTTPIFNWLIWAYGVPALAFAAAAYVLRKTREDMPVKVFEALAIVFAAAFAFLEMRHFIHDGNLLAPDFTLPEQGLTTMLALAFALGLQRINQHSPSMVLTYASLLAGIASFAAIALMHLAVLNPLFTNRPIGAGLIFNDLLLGYALPAVMAGLVFSRGGRPQWYLHLAGGLAMLLAFAYVSLQVRAVYHGEFLASGFTSDAEWYTYSAVWMVFGVVLLAGGLVFNARGLRFASAAITLFTVCKVFLFDLAALEGILRALSFLGLGAVLIAIGLAYQKLLFDAGRDAGQEG